MIVATGQYSDKEAENWIAECLIRRRDKIGQVYLTRGLTLDYFVVRDGVLEWEDLAVKYGFGPKRAYTVQWARWDNERARAEPVTGATGPSLPSVAAPYLAATIGAAGQKHTVTVYLRGDSIVGIDRTW